MYVYRLLIDISQHLSDVLSLLCGACPAALLCALSHMQASAHAQETGDKVASQAQATADQAYDTVADRAQQVRLFMLLKKEARQACCACHTVRACMCSGCIVVCKNVAMNSGSQVDGLPSVISYYNSA
jgi:hypothetical protein